MPNSFAYFMLLIWPVISVVLYKKTSALNASFWTIVGGYMFLPVRVAFDFPLIPPLSKESISTLSALFGLIVIKKMRFRFIPSKGYEKWLIIILIVTPLITVMNNSEAVFRSDIVIPGLTLHDAFSAIINQYIKLLPFLIGLQVVKTYDEQLKLFKLITTAGLVYSLFILFEIRMSPQLHTWFYGFFPHEFSQQKRSDGFRAVVFMGHGLLVALFVAVVVGTTTTLWKLKEKLFFKMGLILIFFLIVLVLSKSAGSLILGITLLTAIAFLSISLQRKLVFFILFVVAFYPLLSLSDLFPHEWLIETARSLDEARAASLKFRFTNEIELLQHAKNKIWFGWGGWGRNRLEDSVTDGYWIIVFGQYGLIGFWSLFGLVFITIIKGLLFLKLDFDRKYKILLSAHILILAVVMVDQLPNASLNAWLWFLIGSLSGVISSQKKKSAFNL